MYHFECKQKGLEHFIKMPSMLNTSMGDAFRQQSQAWLSLPVSAHILDFSGVLSVDATFYPAVIGFGRLLKENKVSFSSIHVSPMLAQRLKNDGVLNAFALQPAPTPSTTIGAGAQIYGKMDMRLIQPFTLATIDVFATQTSTVMVPQKPFVRTDNTTLDIGVMSLIPLNCASFHGSLALCFPRNVFLQICDRMLGKSPKLHAQQGEDAIAQLLSIIFSSGKTQLLREQGIGLQTANPTVLRGEKLQLRHHCKSPVIILPFSGDVGIFHAELAVDPLAVREKRGA